MSEVLIEFKDVVKNLQNRNVLDHFNLSILEGETFVVIGRSGEGKSVLLKHIIGLMEQDSGEIFIGSQNIEKLSFEQKMHLRRDFSYLFQNGALFDSLTLGQNILFALDHLCADLSSKEKIDRTLYALDRVGLKGFEDVLPANVSGGMAKRAALARAIVTEPKVVLFDEPTSGLDPIMTGTIDELILSIKKEMNTTFIVVTHDMNSAKTISDRVGFLYQGKMIFLGSYEEMEAKKDPFIDQFLRGDANGPMTDDYNKELNKMKEALDKKRRKRTF